MEEYRVKVCLIGESAVGKTCLIRRYVLDMFDDSYLSTIGTKVSKKNIIVQREPEEVDLTMLIWDIMGQRNFTKEAYFYGAKGALAVCDVTRPDTLDKLGDWIDSLFAVSREVPIVVLGNKADLADRQKVTPDDLEDFATDYDDAPTFLTSAKTGNNVQKAFEILGKRIISKSD